jgi:tRNA (guanine-N7-)-methyltransferase
VSQCLLTDYAYIMKPGARLYVVTDVLELHQHQVGCLEHHPMFTKTTDDLFVKLIRTQTDEAKKVIKEGGSVYHAVY